MIKLPLFMLLMLFLISIVAQNKPIYVYDYSTGVIDSLPPIDIDTTLTEGVTDFYTGNFNSTVADLLLSLPTEDIYAGSNFTVKRRIEDYYELEDYPVRTTVKIWKEEDGELFNRCSGSLISKRHVLSGAHCFVGNENDVFENESLAVSPIYNNGEANSNFETTAISKIYFTKDWTFQGEDFAILELVEPIGEETGWISVGFNDYTDELFQGVFYKFSYPNITTDFIDSNEYNGDTLYFNYGALDFTTTYSIGVQGAGAIPGESGSSIIKVSEVPEYTSYGVLSFSSNISHQRFTNHTFHAIQDIISDDLILGLEENPSISFEIWPNPARNILNVDGIRHRDVIAISIFDAFGKSVPTGYTGSDARITIDASQLKSGMYFINLETVNGRLTEKFVKL